MTDRKITRRATFTEKVGILEMLKERLHAVGETELFRYEDGWSDERIAQTVELTLPANITAKVRVECFGLLYKSGGSPSAGKRLRLNYRVTATENQIRRILDWLEISFQLNAQDRSKILGNIRTNEDAEEAAHEAAIEANSKEETK